MKITALCLDWHIKNSDAFRDMLVEPLRSSANIELTAWDGEQIPIKPNPDIPLIFAMLPPPSALLKNSKQRMVWLPMWDQAQGYSQEWWDSLPKTLRVVAFSDVIYQKATAAKLPVLRITYFKNPADFTRVSWDNGPIVFYWNRVGMIGPEFLKKLCNAINPSKLLFMAQLDPRIEENKYYELTGKIGLTEIINIRPSDRDTFLKETEAANILIAPRLTEGVGMTFLEAMCRGGTVFANNAPTMSEYIRHGHNGILLDNTYHTLQERLRARLKRTPLVGNDPAPYLLSDHQAWDKLSGINFQAIGDRAEQDHQLGYNAWQKDIKKYTDFVLNW